MRDTEREAETQAKAEAKRALFGEPDAGLDPGVTTRAKGRRSTAERPGAPDRYTFRFTC